MKIHHKNKLNVNIIIPDDISYFQKKWYISKNLIINNNKIKLKGFLLTNALCINDFPNKLGGNLHIIKNENNLNAFFNLGFGECSNIVFLNKIDINKIDNFDIYLNINDCLNNLYNMNSLNDNISLISFKEYSENCI